jgi:UDP-N-acetylglucosamine 3-dehydrogenase
MSSCTEEGTSSRRVAVVGVGTMGRQHARIYHALTGVELVAVADIDGLRARRVASELGCRAYPDHRRLFEYEELDAISAVVPTSLHLEVASAALASGLDVLVEKPLATSVADAEQLAEQAERLRRVLAVGHVERFNPAVRELKRRIDDGSFGSVTSVIARRVGILPPRVTDTNVVVDFAIHDIDVCNYLMGRAPIRISATGGTARGGPIDYSEIFLDYDGAAGFLQANWLTPIKIRKLTVTGTAGYAELDYITQTLDLYQPSDTGGFSTFNELQERYGSSRISVAPIVQQEPLEFELTGFLARLGDGTGEIVTPREAIDALRVAEAALAQVGRAA